MSTTSTSRRKVRIVTFEGERYRWVVSDGIGGVRLFVRRDDGTGTRLEVPLVRELEGFYWFPEPLHDPGPVTPNIVKALMSAARALGWSSRASDAGLFELPVTSDFRRDVRRQDER